MRTLLVLASFGLFVFAGVGCGDDTTTTTSMDMAMPKDLSASMVDMTKLTCAQIISCVTTCAGSTSCDGTCLSEGSSTAVPLITAFETCLFDTCGPGDGGNGSCSGPTDTSTACTTCLSSTGQNAALGGPCSTEFTNCASH